MSGIDDGSIGTRDGDWSRKLDWEEKVTKVGRGGVSGSGIDHPGTIVRTDSSVLNVAVRE